jgi:hypothetical protein
MYQVIVNEVKSGVEVVAVEVYRQSFVEVNLSKLIALLNKKPRVRKAKQASDKVQE